MPHQEVPRLIPAHTPPQLGDTFVLDTAERALNACQSGNPHLRFNASVFGGALDQRVVAACTPYLTENILNRELPEMALIADTFIDYALHMHGIGEVNFAVLAPSGTDANLSALRICRRYLELRGERGDDFICSSRAHSETRNASGARVLPVSRDTGCISTEVILDQLFCGVGRQTIGAWLNRAVQAEALKEMRFEHYNPVSCLFATLQTDTGIPESFDKNVRALFEALDLPVVVDACAAFADIPPESHPFYQSHPELQAVGRDLRELCNSPAVKLVTLSPNKLLGPMETAILVARDVRDPLLAQAIREVCRISDSPMYFREAGHLDATTMSAYPAAVSSQMIAAWGRQGAEFLVTTGIRSAQCIAQLIRHADYEVLEVGGPFFDLMFQTEGERDAAIDSLNSPQTNIGICRVQLSDDQGTRFGIRFVLRTKYHFTARDEVDIAVRILSAVNSEFAGKEFFEQLLDRCEVPEHVRVTADMASWGEHQPAPPSELSLHAEALTSLAALGHVDGSMNAFLAYAALHHIRSGLNTAGTERRHHLLLALDELRAMHPDNEIRLRQPLAMLRGDPMWHWSADFDHVYRGLCRATVCLKFGMNERAEKFLIHAEKLACDLAKDARKKAAEAGRPLEEPSDFVWTEAHARNSSMLRRLMHWVDLAFQALVPARARAFRLPLALPNKQ